jgi:hypothetical protein
MANQIACTKLAAGAAPQNTTDGDYWTVRADFPGYKSWAFAPDIQQPAGGATGQYPRHAMVSSLLAVASVNQNAADVQAFKDATALLASIDRDDAEAKIVELHRCKLFDKVYDAVELWRKAVAECKELNLSILEIGAASISDDEAFSTRNDLGPPELAFLNRISWQAMINEGVRRADPWLLDVPCRLTVAMSHKARRDFRKEEDTELRMAAELLVPRHDVAAIWLLRTRRRVLGSGACRSLV